MENLGDSKKSPSFSYLWFMNPSCQKKSQKHSGINLHSDCWKMGARDGVDVFPIKNVDIPLLC